MGLIVVEYLIPYFGIILQNAYISTANSDITIRKENGQYVYSCSFSVHSNKESRDSGKSVMGRENVNYTTQEPLTDNVYTVLYNELKLKFPNSIDN